MLTLMCRDPILGFVEPAIEIRRASVDDEAVLWHLLNYASGDPDEMLSVEQLRSDPGLARYVADWGREGDIGLIAVEHGAPVGAAWFRVFPADEPGYGFVADDVPELAIFLEPAARGRGIGRTLMLGLSGLAHGAGFATLSLSVRQNNNVALHLYLDLGYEPVEPGATTTSITLTAATYPSAPRGN
jgi:ribosomal protein S18 acetylase RimI-like enzyme